LLPPIANATGFRCWTASEARTRGEFRAQILWMPARARSSDDAGDDTELAGVLAAIADDVGRISSGARAAIVVEYAGRIAHARKHLPRYQVAGAVRSINDARAAALALIKRAASADLAARRAAAIRAHRKPRAKSEISCEPSRLVL
jgi:hypothetical protein